MSTTEPELKLVIDTVVEATLDNDVLPLIGALRLTDQAKIAVAFKVLKKSLFAQLQLFKSLDQIPSVPPSRAHVGRDWDKL